MIDTYNNSGFTGKCTRYKTEVLLMLNLYFNHNSLHLNCEFSHNSHNPLVVLRKHSNPQLSCGTQQKLHQTAMSSLNANLASGHEHSSAATVFNYRHRFTCNTCYMPAQMAKMTEALLPLELTVSFLCVCVFQGNNLSPTYTNTGQLSRLEAV